jgi:hypothetical protein
MSSGKTKLPIANNPALTVAAVTAGTPDKYYRSAPGAEHPMSGALRSKTEESEQPLTTP